MVACVACVEMGLGNFDSELLEASSALFTRRYICCVNTTFTWLSTDYTDIYIALSTMIQLIISHMSSCWYSVLTSYLSLMLFRARFAHASLPLGPGYCLSPYQESGIHCLIICTIQLLTPNCLGETWRCVFLYILSLISSGRSWQTATTTIAATQDSTDWHAGLNN